VDVADEEQVAAAVEQAAAAGGGRIDVLCNNAAYLGPWHDVVAAPRDEWDRCLQTGLLGTAHFTRAVNYLGLCALAVPNGFTGGGLPTSLQIVCHAGDEAMALRVGWAYEEATDWKDRRPPEPAPARH